MTTGLWSLAPPSDCQHLTDRLQVVTRPEAEIVNGLELRPELLDLTLI